MNTPSQKDVVLIGGGHTHALVLHALKTRSLDNARVTLINPGKTAPYSGMLPGFVAGHYTRSELDIDLEKLCQTVGARRVDGYAVALDHSQKSILLKDGRAIPYTLASFDVGISSQMHALPGFAENAVPAKPLADFATKWDTFRTYPGKKSIAVIGGGIAGAELAMAMAFALRSDPSEVTVHLVDRGKILSAQCSSARKHLLRELSKLSVNLRESVHPLQVTRSAVVLNGGEQIAANFVVGAAGAKPHEWINNTGLELHDGFIQVDASLQTTLPGVFAVGDCAHMVRSPRPKAGVYAVRQAPVLLSNLRSALAGAPLQSYKPQSDYLKLVSLGGKRAFGEKRGWGISGRLLWRLKDKIDRQFMAQF